MSTPSLNPAGTASRLVVSAGRAQRVRVDVFDVIGRRVAEVYDGPPGPGEARALSVSTAGLPAGVYVVRAVGETFVATERLTVVR